MVLVIDTSSTRSAVAVLSSLLEPVAVMVEDSGRSFDLPGRIEAMVDLAALKSVAVATGPGSFTGLRVGVSYALGLAMGLEIPLLGLPTLELAAARARFPATGLAEAGRGRVYWQASGGSPALGEPGEVPTSRPACGWLREATAASLRGAGVTLLDEAELDPFGEAAARALPKARELGYDRVSLEYVHSFGKPV